jgi:hypothetical protein
MTHTGALWGELPEVGQVPTLWAKAGTEVKKAAAAKASLFIFTSILP